MLQDDLYLYLITDAICVKEHTYKKKNFSAYMIIPTGPCAWCLLSHQGFQYPEQQFR